MHKTLTRHLVSTLQLKQGPIQVDRTKFKEMADYLVEGLYFFQLRENGHAAFAYLTLFTEDVEREGLDNARVFLDHPRAYEIGTPEQVTAYARVPDEVTDLILFETDTAVDYEEHNGVQYNVLDLKWDVRKEETMRLLFKATSNLAEDPFALFLRGVNFGYNTPQ